GVSADGDLTADQDVGSDRVHIHSCGNGHYWFRFYSGSLLKSVYGPDTWLTGVRGHGGHFAAN
ncbi:hypothetical protein, partial [Pseudomonas synxantha]|uniref:hypothetical protein n=1 Tax=Pseudomonas synxantha TaxID=47883 RepID=UPI001E3A3FC2